MISLLKRINNFFNSLKGKLSLVVFVIISLYVICIIRLYSIQVLNGDYYRKKVNKTFYRSRILKPLRGDIFDRNMNNLTFFTNDFKRKYPYGYHALQVLGIVGKDNNGLAGIELKYNDRLRGKDGWVAFDRFNMSEKRKEKIDGDNIILTIDLKIQEIVDEELEKGVLETGALRGTAIVSNPKTGEILAMSSYPFFYPDKKSDWKALKNLAISYTYEPGSVLKAIPAIIALEDYLYNENDLIPNTDKGFVVFFDRKFRDHEFHSNKLMSFKECLVHSSNVGFITISSKIKPERMWDFFINLGIGSKTGIELPGEENGLLKKLRDDNSSRLTSISMGIGYSVLATPIQILTLYNTIANNGYLIKPHIVKEIRDHSNKEVKFRYKLEPYMINKIGKKRTFERLKDMLQAVVDSGTAKLAKIEGIEICGKTGTSEKINEKGEYSGKNHNTTFVGFLPKESPELSCIVVLDNPDEKHKFASNSAVPIFRNIIKRILLEPSLPYGDKLRLSDNEVSIEVPQLIGLSDNEAVKLLAKKSIRYQLIGNGDVVINQLPKANAKISFNSKILVFLAQKNSKVGNVPNVLGNTVRTAVSTLLSNGFVPTVEGNGIVVEQFPSAGEKLSTGEKVILKCKPLYSEEKE